MNIKDKPSFKIFLKDFGYRVIRLKYFILVVIALLLQIIAVSIFLLISEDFIKFELFNASVLFGASSTIIVILAIGILVLLRFDKKRDRNKIKLLLDFKKNYQNIKNKYIKDINSLTKAFDSELEDIEIKLGHAAALEKIYNNFLEEFNTIEVPDFLKNAHNFVSNYISSEKQFYKQFSILTAKSELEKSVMDADLANRNYLEEIDKLEKKLKIII